MILSWTILNLTGIEFEMTPGPKKKNFSRRGGDKATDSLQESKKNKSNFESQIGRKNDSTTPNYDKATLDSNFTQEKKYSKRTVTSNWTKYDDPVNDPHADTMRGKDFEVLLSYSGGLESQLRLQDEKEWDDVNIGDKSITLDLQDLVQTVKCIPFHKRMNLPVDIFDGSQYARFNSNADYWKTFFKSKLDLPLSSSSEKVLKELEPMEDSSNIIESYESEEINDVLAKPLVLEEKTESIIESLASCLSMKSLVQKPEEKSDNFDKNEIAADLDFLLSLGTSNITLKEEKSNEQKQTNVDDWLNSLLDD